MSVNSWWHPITVKTSVIVDFGKMILIGYTSLEVIVYLYLLKKNVGALYEYNRAGEKVLTTVKATPYNELVFSTFFIYVFGMIILLLTLLPGFFFYQHYIGTKSIYTMLRLKEKKLHIRFYIENMTISVVAIWVVLLLQFLLYCLGYLIYLTMVPSTNLPEGEFLSILQNPMFQNLLPVLKPYLWFVPICIGFLLPGITQLFALAERSKRRGIIAAAVGLISMVSLYSCYIGVKGYPIYLIIATMATIGTGLFYMNYVEIV